MPYWRLFYHVVWATKGREALIGDREEAVIRRSLKLTFEDLDVVPHAVGMMPDHVHVAISVPPKVAIAEVVRRMKGASAHAVNDANGRANGAMFGWQGEYGVLSFGENTLGKIVAYVSDQSARHARHDLWPTLERAGDDHQSA